MSKGSFAFGTLAGLAVAAAMYAALLWAAERIQRATTPSYDVYARYR